MRGFNKWGRLYSRTLFFIIAALAFLLVLLWIDYKYLSKSNFTDVVVEAHGLFFDIVLFGIILTIYESLIKRKENIKRHLEEIDDYRGSYETEAAFRVAGILKRLQRHKVLIINLNNLNLVNTDKEVIEKNKFTLKGTYFKLAILKKIELSEANLQGAQMYGCQLQGINFEEARMNHADLTGANLIGCNMTNTDLSNANFNNCVMRSASMKGAKLKNTNLRNADIVGVNLKKADLTGTKVYAHQIEDIRRAGGETEKLFIVPLLEKTNPRYQQKKDSPD